MSTPTTNIAHQQNTRIYRVNVALDLPSKLGHLNFDMSQKGESVNLLVPVGGHLYHGEDKLPKNATFVSSQPSSTYGPTTNTNRDVFKIVELHPVNERRVSVSG